MMPKDELKSFLDQKAAYYENRWFIDHDPVQIPHLFSRREDIEIAALFAATLAWGKRSLIVNKSRELMQMMDMAPHDFILNATAPELLRLSRFVHRTFNAVDLTYFIAALREMYLTHGGIYGVFQRGCQGGGIPGALMFYRKVFLSFDAPPRTGKHVANINKNSAAKRLNMFLRWMVRPGSPVDFGLWDQINPADLLIPLDMHVGRVARALGLLSRSQNDFKAVQELTQNLRQFRPHDPVYYDYALFGLGVFEKF